MQLERKDEHEKKLAKSEFVKIEKKTKKLFKVKKKEFGRRMTDSSNRDRLVKQIETNKMDLKEDEKDKMNLKEDEETAKKEKKEDKPESEPNEPKVEKTEGLKKQMSFGLKMPLMVSQISKPKTLSNPYEKGSNVIKYPSSQRNKENELEGKKFNFLGEESHNYEENFNNLKDKSDNMAGYPGLDLNSVSNQEMSRIRMKMSKIERSQFLSKKDSESILYYSSEKKERITNRIGIK